MSFHPRISLHGVSTWNQSFDEDLAFWADIGIDHVSIIAPKLEAAGPDACSQALLDAGLRISSVTGYPHQLADALEFAAAVDAPMVYMPPMGAGPVFYEESAEKYRKEIAPHVARAAELGLRFAMENTNPLQSFVYTVRDAIDLGRSTGVDLVLDFNSSWYERGLAELLQANLDVLALVQICDRKLGATTMNRVAIGDGDLPVERLLEVVLEAGYEGVFELELLGPEIESEGYKAPIVRSLERASDMLDRLGT
jgi:sugar phosphate isomerase/epimerase